MLYYRITENAYIRCPNGYQMYINGVMVGNRTSATPYFSADEYTYSMDAGLTIAFKGMPIYPHY